MKLTGTVPGQVEEGRGSLKVKRVAPLGLSEHFVVTDRPNEPLHVACADANDEVAAKTLDAIAQRRHGDLSAKNDADAKMLIWELDEEYERQWHRQAWIRYSRNLMTKQLDLPEPVRKSKEK